jgi:hypothetical protein
MVEIIGICASLTVLVSFLFKGEINIRLINIFGALVFVIYGILIGSISVWFLNGALIIIHIFKLLALRKANKNEYKTKN